MELLFILLHNPTVTRKIEVVWFVSLNFLSSTLEIVKRK